MEVCALWSAFLLLIVSVYTQVLGHKEGLEMMEQADPLFLLIGLPTIPIILILGKMIRWEDYVLRVWRKYSSKLYILNYIFPGVVTMLFGNLFVQICEYMYFMPLQPKVSEALFLGSPLGCASFRVCVLPCVHVLLCLRA